MSRARHNTLLEGILTGALGASTVAGWFLAVDLLAGAPFQTPSILGAALLGLPSPAPGELQMAALVAYTVFHYAAFAVVGLTAAASTHLAESQPVVLALFAVLFVTFEVGFYGLVAMLHASELLGGLAWYQIGAGNLLASGIMGGFLLQTHPRIRRGIVVALGR